MDGTSQLHDVKLNLAFLFRAPRVSCMHEALFLPFPGACLSYVKGAPRAIVHVRSSKFGK